jgi:hypothetical protein
VAGVQEALGPLVVQADPLALPVRAVRATLIRALVPVQAEPVQRLLYRRDLLGDVFRGGLARFDVRGAQHEGAAGVAREGPAVQGGAHVAQVQAGLGRRRKPDPDRRCGLAPEPGVSHG